MKGHTSVPSAGWFWRLQLKIHDDRLLAIPHDYSFARLIWISINLLVRHIRGNVNKISGSGFVTEFQSIAPAHPHSSFHHDRLCENWDVSKVNTWLFESRGNKIVFTLFGDGVPIKTVHKKAKF